MAFNAIEKCAVMRGGIKMSEVNKEIDLEAIQSRKGKGPTKNVPISLRVSENVSKWLREKKYSPTGIFHEALRLLGCPYVEGAETEQNEAIEKDIKEGVTDGNNGEAAGSQHTS